MFFSKKETSDFVKIKKEYTDSIKELENNVFISFLESIKDSPKKKLQEADAYEACAVIFNTVSRGKRKALKDMVKVLGAKKTEEIVDVVTGNNDYFHRITLRNILETEVGYFLELIEKDAKNEH